MFPTCSNHLSKHIELANVTACVVARPEMTPSLARMARGSHLGKDMVTKCLKLPQGKNQNVGLENHHF